MSDMVDYTNSTLSYSRARATSRTQDKVSCWANSANCQACGKPMKKIQGTYGAFWGCTGFPDCKGSRGILK